MYIRSIGVPPRFVTSIAIVICASCSASRTDGRAM